MKVPQMIQVAFHNRAGHQLIPAETPVPQNRPELAADLVQVLNKLRFLASRCRASARLDLFRACDMLSVDEPKAAQSAAIAVLRTLDQAIEGRFIMRGPGAEDISFDEKWLMRLLERASEKDFDSMEFLIFSRVSQEKRRAFGHIVNALAERLQSI